MADFPKEFRLLNQADYNSVFTKSVKVSDSLFLILIHKTSKKHSRLGLVISKKVDKRAVQRNRIKRICRESFRSHEFSINCDFVVLARAKAVTLQNKEIFSALDLLWAKAEAKVKHFRNKK